MEVLIHPRKLSGIVDAPPSKSVAQRYIAAALIARSKTKLTGLGSSQDVQDALNIAKSLGAKISTKGELTAIDSSGLLEVPTEILMGESGLAARMFLPIIAVFLNGKSVVLSAVGSLQKRPMDFFKRVLPQLGISVEMGKGRFPISLSGRFLPKDIAVDAAGSSQYITGLLMAYAAAGAADCSITVQNLVSDSYVELTLKCIEEFGLCVVETSGFGYAQPQGAVAEKHAIDIDAKSDKAVQDGNDCDQPPGAGAGKDIISNAINHPEIAPREEKNSEENSHDDNLSDEKLALDEIEMRSQSDSVAERAAVEASKITTFHFNNLEQEKPVLIFHIPGDWSNAAFWLVAATLGNDISIANLQADTQQGDSAIVGILQRCGAKILWNKDVISIISPESLIAFCYDATDTPDLFPPLVVLALGCEGVSTIAGVHRLLHKESNRAETLCSEFRKLGARMEIQDDNLIIFGKATLRGGNVQAHADHRIAMALAIAALQAESSVTILGAQCVTKSYPDFFEELERLQNE